MRSNGEFSGGYVSFINMLFRAVGLASFIRAL